MIILFFVLVMDGFACVVAWRPCSLFVLVVGHDLPLSLTLSLTLCFDDKMIYFSVCVLVKNSFFVFGHSVLFW